MKVLGWRDGPVDNSSLSQDPEILESEPSHYQGFFSKPEGLTEDQFERKLYLLRRVISNSIYLHFHILYIT